MGLGGRGGGGGGYEGRGSGGGGLVTVIDCVIKNVIAK